MNPENDSEAMPHFHFQIFRTEARYLRRKFRRAIRHAEFDIQLGKNFAFRGKPVIPVRAMRAAARFIDFIRALSD